MKTLSKEIRMSLRASLQAKQSELYISVLLILIATTFKSWATITEQLLALAKYGFSGLAKAKFSFLIYPRSKGRGNSTLLSLNQN
jgi:hypothetical protein